MLLFIVLFLVGVVFWMLGLKRFYTEFCISIILATLFCKINPEETYYWYSGIWHGMFFIPNLLLHCFFSNALYKANVYTMAYNINWWIFTIFFSYICMLVVICIFFYSKCLIRKKKMEMKMEKILQICNKIP